MNSIRRSTLSVSSRSGPSWFRPFSSSVPSPTPLSQLLRLRLHPTTRTRLTNSSFYLVALLSLLTVSLAMSGVGPAAGLPCPARVPGTRGVGLEGQKWDIEPPTTRSPKLNSWWWERRNERQWLEDPIVMTKRLARKKVISTSSIERTGLGPGPVNPDRGNASGPRTIEVKREKGGKVRSTAGRGGEWGEWIASFIP